MKEMRTTSYCGHKGSCDLETIRKGYIKCEVSKGLCSYQSKTPIKRAK